jgi:ribosomal protein S18 acetylase RimI-like enzyme
VADPVSSDLTVVRWSAEDLRTHIDRAIEIYCAAMDYPAETGQARKGYMLVHTGRAGFRAVAAVDDLRQPMGFCYGYAGAPGQWWHDEVSRQLPPDLLDRWLADSFEVCELHVDPPWHNRGIGRRLLTTLLDGCPNATVVLSTPEGESLAWHLYRRMGFVDVRRGHRFPGDGRAFAVLGVDLPLDRERAG